VKPVLLLAALSLGLALPVRADDAKPICPDRPGKGTSACTVEAGRWQAELGLADGTFQHRAGITTDVISAGNLLLKYGISDSVDLEAGMALYQAIRTHGLGAAQTAGGNGDLYLHAKWNVGGNGPLMVLLDPFVKLPTASGPLGNGAAEGGLVVPLSLDLGNGWSLGESPEADLLRDTSDNGYHMSATNLLELGRTLKDRFTLGAEVWTAQNFDPAGTVSQYSADVYAAWLTDLDTQLDAGINFGLNRATPDLELYAGVSRRF
jgi:Putative MetA-pathway of phenol degradation